MKNKKLINWLINICIAIISVTSCFAQNANIEIKSKIPVSIDFCNDLEYKNNIFIVHTGDDLIYIDTNGRIIKKEVYPNIKGISCDENKRDLFFLNNKMNVNKYGKNQEINLKYKRSYEESFANSKFLALTETGYIIFYQEGWGSNIVYFNSFGNEITRHLASGLGKVTGLTFLDGNIFVIYNLGDNKNGIVKQFVLSTDKNKISYKNSYNLPVINPKGITYNNSCFYTFSEKNKEIIKFNITKK